MASSIFKPLPKPPPVNGVPQWGKANPKSTTPFYGNIIKTLRPNIPTIFRGGALGGAGAQQQQSGGGGNPYAGILSEFLNSAKSRFAADSAADAASRDAALRRYIISYGQVPDFDTMGISKDARGFLEKALDANTRSLAEKNTAEGTSVYARMKAANDVANRRIPAMRAAQGMLRSGQTGSDLADQAQNYKIQGFDTLNEMLGSVEGTVGNFLQAERARADALAQAELQAQMAAMDNYGGDMYGDPEPQYPPAGGSTVPKFNTTVWKPPKPAAKVFLGSTGAKKKRVLTTATARNRRK